MGLWKIRPIEISNLEGQIYKLDKKIYQIQSPLTIGTLKTIFETPNSDWNYQLLYDIPLNKSGEIQNEIIQHRPNLISLASRIETKSGIMINKNKFTQISRIHATIGKDEHGEMYIIDLDSVNGTYVSGFKLKPKEPYKLKDEDIILLGGNKKDCAKFKIYEPIRKINALFIGADHENKQIERIEEMLKRYDEFFSKINIPYEKTVLKHQEATRNSILRKIENAQTLPKNNLFILYYNAHGCPNYMTTGINKEYVSKKELSQKINKIKAKKMVIIDACHSGGGWSFNDKGQYYFSSEHEQLSYWKVFNKELLEEFEKGYEEGVIEIKKLDLEEIKSKIRKKGFSQKPIRKGMQSIII